MSRLISSAATTASDVDEVPANASSEVVPPRSALVRREWIMANGSRFVILKDRSNAGWEAYCAEVNWIARGDRNRRLLTGVPAILGGAA